MAWQAQVILSALALGVLGCGNGIIEAASDELGDGGSGSESGDEIGDVETGTSSGATTTDPSTTDESTTESTTTESTTDPSTTDESTTESTTTESTTDTAVDTACTEPISFIIPATDYASISGWTVTMSTLGEGMVLSIPDNVNEAIATFDLDIPCDDTWHVWVRGIEQGEYDSYWIRVDGEPQDWAVFDLDCTMSPMDITYEWREINWHDANCQYLENPWVHDWGVGLHSLELGYRESWAISKIWVSNTGGTPP